MNRTAKRLLALATSAAMAFSVSFSAFAEQATPETAQYAQSVSAQSVQDEETGDTVATLTVARSAEGSQTSKSYYYTDLQEALNELEKYQFDTTGDAEGEEVNYSAAVILNNNVQGSFTVPAYTSNRSDRDRWPALDLNGYTITAVGDTALTLEKGALLDLTDNGAVRNTGKIVGGEYSAIYAKDTSRTSLFVRAGIYTSDSDTIIKTDAEYPGMVQVSGGLYNKQLPDYLICPDYENVHYSQVEEDGYWTVKMTIDGVVQEDVAQDEYGNTYTTVQAAVDANNGKITLLKDATESIKTDGKLEMDFNGHVLTAEADKDYAISAAELDLDDSTGGKGGTIGAIVLPISDESSVLSFIRNGTYRARAGENVLNVGSTFVQVYDGTYYGSEDQPVFLCGGKVDEGGHTNAAIVFFGGKIYAGSNQSILAKKTDMPGCGFSVVYYANNENSAFYGDLGVTDPQYLRLTGGRFDREPPANCVDSSNEPMKVVKEGDFWVVRVDQDNYPVSVTWNDGTETRFANVSAALSQAVQKDEYCTVTLLKDVTENVSTYLDPEKKMNSIITLDLNGHTLTAKDTTVPAICSINVRLTVDGKNGAMQAAGTVNGYIDSNTYLYIIHTTVNAPAGYPAIINENNNDSVSVKGRSVINGAADQPVILSNSTINIGDDSTIKAGANGALFVTTKEDAGTCFVLDMATLYGDLGAVKNIKVNTANGKCFTKFDRIPADVVIPAGFMAVKSGNLYELQAAPANALVGDQKFQTLQEAIDYAAENGGTPKMVKSLTENITTPAGSVMTIDMAGCTLTGTVTANGLLDLNNGNVNGKIVLGANGSVRFTNYNALDNATLPEGYSLSVGQDDDGYFQVVKYDTAIHNTVKTAVEKVNAYLATINSSYKLETLTEEQINSLAGKAYGDDNNPIVAQYKAIMALDQAAMRHQLSSTRIDAPYNEPLFKLVNYLYKTATMQVETDKQKVSATVDTSKTEAPAVDEKVPEDKKPTQEQAAAKAEEIKTELTTNVSEAVSSFKKNNLNNAIADVKSLPNVNEDSEVKLYVLTKLQDIQLGANVEKDDKGEVTEVKLTGKTLVFDVTPMVQVDDKAAEKIENEKLNGSKVVFRLPIPADVTDKYAVVSHAGDADRYIEIRPDDDGKKYIEVSATHFSVFTVNFTNTLPVTDDKTVTTPAATPAATPAPAAAQKDDGKNIYYTCTACGYHDWTATADGYKCDHCGHIESVKQLSGYSNVKGVYEPKTSTAAQKAAVKSAAIPQTSDDMPIAAITVVALAALLGFGLTAFRKFHH